MFLFFFLFFNIPFPFPPDEAGADCIGLAKPFAVGSISAYIQQDAHPSHTSRHQVPDPLRVRFQDMHRVVLLESRYTGVVQHRLQAAAEVVDPVVLHHVGEDALQTDGYVITVRLPLWIRGAVQCGMTRPSLF